MTNTPSAHQHGDRRAMGRHYVMLGINLTISTIIMYFVMFSMIDGTSSFFHNINMFYMALTMWAPMGIFMLATMPGMFPKKGLNMALYAIFAAVTLGSFGATRAQVLVDDRQFIDSMIPHHSGAILMCREARLRDAELLALCDDITKAQRSEIDQMESIRSRLD